MDDEQLREIVRRASEIAKAAPESLREAAFNRTFEALTQVGARDKSAPKSTAKKSAPKSRPSEDTTAQNRTAYILENLDRTSIPEISSAPRVLDRSLYLLRGVNEKLNIDGLSPAEIATILTEKFRSRTSRQAVTQALDAAGQYVDRVQRGGRVVYRIMARGEEFLDSDRPEPITSARAAGKSKKNTSHTKKRAPESPATDTNASAKSTREKKRNAGISPMSIVRQLREDGYFDSSRRMGEIQSYLKDSKGYQVSFNNLSPTLVRLVRANLLERTRAEDGQYEYKRK